VSNPKVFEFAKEIGYTPLALMDKIKEWKLPVRSHMAELDPDTLEIIRARLREPNRDSGASERKPVARKKAPAKAVAPAKPTAPIKAGAPKPAAKAVEVSADSLSKPGAAVVRRKVKSVDSETALDGGLESAIESSTSEAPEVQTPVAAKSIVERATPIVAATPAASLAAAPATTIATTIATNPVATPAVTVAPSIAKEEMAPVALKSSAPTAIADSPAVVSAPQKIAEAKVVIEVQETKAPTAAVEVPPEKEIAEKVEVPPVAPIVAAPIAPVAEDTSKKPLISRKKEVAIGASGVASAGASAVGRRNIVGKMDLSRVQAPAGTSRPGASGERPQFGGSRPGPGSAQGGGGGPGSAPGFAAGNRSKGNLRAGFFRASTPMTPPPPLPDLHDDHSKKKFDDKRRNKGQPQEGGAKEVGDQPPVFDASEFRKREMVFQPKKRKGSLSRPAMKTEITKSAAHKRVLRVSGPMKVSVVAAEMGIKAAELVKILMKNGVQASMNADLDFDTIALISPEFGWEAVSAVRSVDEILGEATIGEVEAERIERPPVVTVMGHVDHGKTSLLDAIRSAKVAAGEAGGITQHIGAYQVSLPDGYKITFLDTPGHEAFTAMRARGANVTDIAIIVVAADDGVMPQTVEAINHAKAAKVPIIVAVNKMDKPGANPDRIKQQLTEYEIVPEEWGGTTIFAPVSALKGTGIPELLVQIKLLAEVGEFKANPQRAGKGTVIESRLEKGRGPVATLLVQDGTIKIGQYVVAGKVNGRVRSLMNYKGEKVESAGPGMPVEILGLESVPQAGDNWDVAADDETSRRVAQLRSDAFSKANQTSAKMSLEDMFAKVQRGDLKELPVILKSDVAGSLEAIQGMFQKLGNAEVKLKVVHAAVGGITSTDVLLASTAKGLIIGFNVRPDGNAASEARRLNVEIRSYSIVYEMVDDIKKAMAGLLSPTTVEKVNGRAEVRNTFSVPKIGTIAGCFVSDGKIARSNLARLLRDGKIIYEGKISSLKRFKDDAREVATGFECGIGIENFNDMKVGDMIEAFSREEVQRTLDEAPAQPSR